MQRRQNQLAGFTIIELMAALAIFSLILFMVNELFQSTTTIVTRSVQTSKVIAATRVLNEQIADDFDNMVGPSDSGNGGYLVIIQERLRDVPLIDAQTLTEVTIPQMRVDQIAFIRDAGGLRSLTPQNPGSFGSNLVGQTGDRARVWYGHARRTTPTGQLPGNTPEFLLGGSAAGFDKLANNWIFARQALLFNPTNLALPETSPRQLSDNPGAYTHAVDSSFNSDVINANTYPGPRQLRMGITDVTVQSYADLYGQLTDAALNDNQRGQRYLDTAFRFRGQRLFANANPGATNFESWAIAQTHGILVNGCSEIIIDFAADLNGNGRIDTTEPTGDDRVGSIIWYDAIENPQVGTPSLQWTPRTAGSPPAPVPQPFVAVASTADYKAFVFRVDDGLSFADTGATVGTAGTPHSYWPYLIRIRYRLHDTRGQLATANPAAGRDGKDNDGDGVIDNREEARTSGRWVENIIRVPRP